MTPSDMKFYYVYLLECQTDKSWYIGYTGNLKTRVEDHQKGKGCRTTSMKKNWKLIYYESYLNKADALGREKFLKGGSGRKYLKKQLVRYFDNGITIPPLKTKQKLPNHHSN